eukprot:7389871-Prymnesium_polylepis.1
MAPETPGYMSPENLAPGTCPPKTSRRVHVPRKIRAGYMSPDRGDTCPSYNIATDCAWYGSQARAS